MPRRAGCGSAGLVKSQMSNGDTMAPSYGMEPWRFLRSQRF